jgi:competence ComEA-like helix-hairpin-helix protein
MKSGSVVITGVLASVVSIITVWALFVGLSSGVEGAESAVAVGVPVAAGQQQPTVQPEIAPTRQDISQIERAEPLSDQPEPEMPALVDINTSSSNKLETLPGIGPVLAGRIIEYRSHTPFQDIAELEKIKGIGPKKLAALRGLVTAGAVSVARMR